MANNRNISQGTRQKLWGRSGGLCNICRIDLTQNGISTSKVLGEIAHIEGLNPDSPRYNKEMSIEERNSYENLILLCPNHHTEIDTQIEKYSIFVLREIKTTHELFVQESYKRSIPNVSFTELDIIIKYLSYNKKDGHSETDLIPLTEKIRKNQLTSMSENLIKMGLARVDQVSDYVNSNLDPFFESRLIGGFVDRYNQFVLEGLVGDDLFIAMQEFSHNGDPRFEMKAAGLVVLVYLFERCEVFEK